MTGRKAQKSGLTAAWVKRAKPKDKPYKLSDRDGLYLLVEPSGSRVWRMNYRLRGKQRTITLGRWPELLLGEARERLLDARRLLANGIDPVEQAKLDKIAQSIAATNTFQAVAEEWLDKIEKEGMAAMTAYRRAPPTPSDRDPKVNAARQRGWRSHHPLDLDWRAPVRGRCINAQKEDPP